jgi:hypothetical protein
LPIRSPLQPQRSSHADPLVPTVRILFFCILKHSFTSFVNRVLMASPSSLTATVTLPLCALLLLCPLLCQCREMFHDRVFDERYDLKQPKLFVPDIQKMNPGRHQYGLNPLQINDEDQRSYQGDSNTPFHWPFKT